MFRSIAFKEWLKIRWAAVLSLAVLLVLMGEMALSLRHAMQFNPPIMIWNAVVLLNYQYYDHVRFLPLAIGLAIAAAQFIPEVVQGRLILSLHLPMRENAMMLRMLAIGFSIVAALLVLLLVLVTVIGAFFFPWEILRRALVDAAAWSLAGCAGYLAASAAIVEPRWIRRGLLVLAGAGVADMLLLAAGSGAYAPSLPFFVLLTGCCSIAILLSAHRFRRGVR